MQINLKISIDFILAKETKKHISKRNKKTYSVLEYAQIVITIATPIIIKNIKGWIEIF